MRGFYCDSKTKLMHLKLFWKIGEFCKISEVENKAKSFYTRFFKENKFESHLLRQLSNDIVKN